MSSRFPLVLITIAAVMSPNGENAEEISKEKFAFQSFNFHVKLIAYLFHSLVERRT